VREDATRQSVLFAHLFSKPLLARFDERHGSSDGGAILLKACDASLGLTRRLAECLWIGARPGRRGCEHITIDLDPTDDPTHGGQQLTFFNGHYDTWCHLPVAGFITFNHEPEQHLFSYVLRPGNAPATPGRSGLFGGC
jgi:hypothetical protein